MSCSERVQTFSAFDQDKSNKQCIYEQRNLSGYWILRYQLKFKEALSRRFGTILAKTAQIFDKEPFPNKKLFLEHREENIKEFLRGRTDYNQLLATSLKYTGRT